MSLLPQGIWTLLEGRVNCQPSQVSCSISVTLAQLGAFTNSAIRQCNSLPVIYRWMLLPRISCSICSRGDWWWQHQPGTDSVRHFTRSSPYYRCCALYLYRGAHKAISRLEFIALFLQSGGVPPNQNNCDQTAILEILDHKECLLCCQWEKLSYCLIYIFRVLLFPFFCVGKKTSFY